MRQMRRTGIAATLLLLACSTHGTASPAAAAVTKATVTSQPGAAKVVLHATDRSGTGIARTEYRIDDGPWTTYQAPQVALLDRTSASFARWRFDGGGSFERQPDGSVRTVGGLGMLWFPERRFGDIALRLSWQDLRAGSNGGVLIRFPDPRAGGVPRECQRGVGFASLALLRPEWIAVTCGHEIQVNDGSIDPQQTGSVYNFKSVAKPASRPAPAGTWNDFEIRITGGGSYRVIVIRNGVRINDFTNSPGQQAARVGDPPTDARQVASGYIGLQNHGYDVIAYRDVSVRDLRPEAAAFLVRGAGRHVVSFRSTDWAGRVEQVRQVVIRV